MHAELIKWFSGPLDILPEWAEHFATLSHWDVKPSDAKGYKPSTVKPGVVAVMGVRGPIVAREGFLTNYYGFVSSEWVKNTIRGLASDSSVKAIVMDFDSPGGEHDGLGEAAEAIREARKSKPIVAVSNGLMASAAYYLGSQASEVVASRSSLTGSIGTIIQHQDVSKAEENIGVKTTFIHAGKYKTEGNPYEPLGDEARNRLQVLVDDAYREFTEDVAKGRGVRAETVRAGFGQGRVLTASEALSERLVDRVGSLDSVVAKLANRQRSAESRARAIKLAEA